MFSKVFTTYLLPQKTRTDDTMGSGYPRPFPTHPSICTHARTHARTRFTTLSSFSMSSDIHDLSTRRSSARLQLSTLVAISRALSSSCITTAALSAAHSSVYLALTAAFTVLLISWFLFAHLSIVRFPARFPNTLSPLSVLFVRSQGLRSLPRGTLTLPRALATRCSSCHHDHAYAHATL